MHRGVQAVARASWVGLKEGCSALGSGLALVDGVLTEALFFAPATLGAWARVCWRVVAEVYTAIYGYLGGVGASPEPKSSRPLDPTLPPAPTSAPAPAPAPTTAPPPNPGAQTCAANPNPNPNPYPKPNPNFNPNPEHRRARRSAVCCALAVAAWSIPCCGPWPPAARRLVAR